MPRIHHVNLPVLEGRLAETAQFYREVIGLDVVERPVSDRRGEWLAIDESSELHLSERGQPPHPQAHVALVVDDFLDMRARAVGSGASWDEGPDLFGGGRAFTRDPSGNRVEVLERAGSLA